MENLGFYIALFVLGAINAVSFIINVIYLRFGGGPNWLKPLVLAQLIPALVFFWITGSYFYERWDTHRYWEQVVRVDQEISADSVDGYLAAMKSCNDSCRYNRPPEHQLRYAADHGSKKVATHLIRTSLRSDLERPDGPWTYDICEKDNPEERDSVSALDALTIAVIRGDRDMIELLFPISDVDARNRAMVMAVQLDRLEIVARLSQLGVMVAVHPEAYDTKRPVLILCH